MGVETNEYRIYDLQGRVSGLEAVNIRLEARLQEMETAVSGLRAWQVRMIAYGTVLVGAVGFVVPALLRYLSGAIG